MYLSGNKTKLAEIQAITGMMEEFGLTKPSCFISLATATEVNEPTTFWLVDDLIDEFEKLDFGKIKVCLVNPKEL